MQNGFAFQNNNQIRKQSLQDQKKIEGIPTPIIQKIDLNGILQPQVHSSSSSSNVSFEILSVILTYPAFILLNFFPISEFPETRPS